MEYTVVPGTVVISSAGHDSGRYAVVTGVDGRYVYIADGKERKLDSPKKKNIRHVRATKELIELSGLTDKKLRVTLRAMSAQGITEESE